MELLLYCTSLTGVVAFVPVGLWFLGFNDQNSLLMILLAAPFLLWGAGVIHWRGFELARPHITAGLYGVASAFFHLKLQFTRELKRRRELHITSSPWAKVSFAVGKIVS